MSLSELDYSLQIVFGFFSFDHITDAQHIDVNEATVDFECLANLEPEAPNKEKVQSYEDPDQLCPHDTIL